MYDHAYQCCIHRGTPGLHQSTRTGKLYEKVLHERYNIHDAIRNQPGSRTTTFHITNSEAELGNDILQSLAPIDVAQSKHHITILCSSNINQHGCHTIPAVQNKYSFYRKLPKSLVAYVAKFPYHQMEVTNYWNTLKTGMHHS
jgi:hypothetical protein